MYLPPPLNKFSPNNPTPDDQLKVSLCGDRRPFGSKRNKIDFDVFGLGGLPDPDDPNDLTLADGPGCVGWVDAVLTENGGWETGSYLINVRWDKEDFVLYQILVDVTEDGGKYVITTSEGQTGSPDEIPTSFVDAPAIPSKIKTPLGEIETSAQGLAKAILGLALGIAGGVAFLMMIFGAYRLMFAGGNPESVQQGREVITAAVAGLVVIIFAIFILRLLGITILGLPITG